MSIQSSTIIKLERRQACKVLGVIMIQYLANFGGILTILIFIHFFTDWLFQSHAEAMVKHNHSAIRAKHCAIYTLGFVPLLALTVSPFEFLASISILFFSHFYLDTYHLVFLWAKYIRRPPEMNEDPVGGFIQFVSTPLGKILMIAIDQISHITCLLPVVWMIMRHLPTS